MIKDEEENMKYDSLFNIQEWQLTRMCRPEIIIKITLVSLIKK